MVDTSVQRTTLESLTCARINRVVHCIACSVFSLGFLQVVSSLVSVSDQIYSLLLMAQFSSVYVIVVDIKHLEEVRVGQKNLDSNQSWCMLLSRMAAPEPFC